MAAKKKAKKKITKKRVGRPAKKAPRGRVGRPPNAKTKTKAKKKTKVTKKRVGRPAGKKVGKKKRVGRPAKQKATKAAKKRVGRPPGKVAKKRPGRPAKKKTKATKATKATTATKVAKRPVGRPRKYPAAIPPVRKKKRTIGRGRRSAGDAAGSGEDEKHLGSHFSGNDARGALADLGDDELFDDDK